MTLVELEVEVSKYLVVNNKQPETTIVAAADDEAIKSASIHVLHIRVERVPDESYYCLLFIVRYLRRSVIFPLIFVWTPPFFSSRKIVVSRGKRIRSQTAILMALWLFKSCCL